MAIGDDAQAAGMPIVPDSGEAGKVAYGAREINRTRDFIANKSRSGTAVPSNSTGNDGDVYFRVV